MEQSIPRVQEAMGITANFRLPLFTIANLSQMAEMKEEKRKQGRWW